MTRVAIYLDRQGKPPTAVETKQIESADAVKLAKFFVALGFTAEKQTTLQGGQYILAKANGVQLSIVTSRTPQPAGEWNMTLLVDDIEGALARAESVGATVASPIKEVPGAKKCVIMSPDGQRVVLAQKLKTKPVAAAAPVTKPSPTIATPEAGGAATPIAVHDERAKAPVFDAVFDAVEVEIGSSPERRLSELLLTGVSSMPVDETATDDDDEKKPRYVVASVVRTIQRLRVTTAITAGSWAISLVAYWFCQWFTRHPPAFFGNSRQGSAEQLISMICAAITFVAGLAIALGKLPCRDASERIGNRSLLMFATYCDLATLVVSLSFPLAEYAYLPMIALVGLVVTLICALASPLLFLPYLAQVARFVNMPKLASMLRVTQMFIIAFTAFGLMVALAAGLRLRGALDLFATLATIGTIVTGLIGFFCYLIGMAIFAVRARAPEGPLAAE